MWYVERKLHEVVHAITTAMQCRGDCWELDQIPHDHIFKIRMQIFFEGGGGRGRECYFMFVV